MFAAPRSPTLLPRVALLAGSRHSQPLLSPFMRIAALREQVLVPIAVHRRALTPSLMRLNTAFMFELACRALSD